jgi:hypothetical protein
MFLDGIVIENSFEMLWRKQAKSISEPSGASQSPPEVFARKRVAVAAPAVHLELRRLHH